jgi:stage II sporulation protein D
VLLDEQQELDGNAWKLSCDKGFMLGDPRTNKKVHFPSTDLRVRITNNGTIYVNNKKMFDEQLYIMPLAAESTCNDKTYQGSFWVISDEQSHKLINCLHIEDYVVSVLATESYPGWCLEVNKAFAIASRTYVIAMVQNAAVVNRPYHVKNTNIHQTYSGTHNFQVFKDAVEETKGLFVAYKGQPITAMFDACCGGIIPAKMRGVDFKAAPYLARKKPCEYCKVCKVYSWQAKFDIDELEEKFKKELGSLKKLKDVKITRKDEAGIVHELGVRGSRMHALTGKKVYSLLNKDVRSFCYTVQKNGDTITFKGRGYGHHLGVCQWGAKEMVADGWDYESVLAFYYPGTKLMRLS